jgi:uncharacterized membrane protein YhdT
MIFISELNNRETAIALWAVIALLIAISTKSVRHALSGVLKAFFVKKIIIPILFMLVYVSIMIVFYAKINFWDISALKDTVFWVAGTAFVFFFKINEILKDEHYFEKAIIDNIKLAAILEFIMNLYSFAFAIEFLILVPMIVLISTLRAVALSKPIYKLARIALDYILGLLGIVIIAYTIREISTDFHGFATLKNLRDFLLPLAFTITYIPFVYLVTLYSQYDNIFMRIDFANKNSNLTKYAKQKILITFHFNLRKLTRFSKKAGWPEFHIEDDVTNLISQTKSE